MREKNSENYLPWKSAYCVYQIAKDLINFVHTMSADNELSSILNRRQQINEALENGEDVQPKQKIKNIYIEFSRKQLKEYQALFSRLLNLCWFDLCFFFIEIDNIKLNTHRISHITTPYLTTDLTIYGIIYINGMWTSSAHMLVSPTN